MRPIALLVLLAAPGAFAQDLFRDDFESGLDGWTVSDPSAIRVVDSGDERHGGVLLLEPAHATLLALIDGSEAWPAYRIEGSVLFPTDEQNYLGFLYHAREVDGRFDLGSVYIKGNGSYIRVNPRRDWNPGRMLYEELHVALEGDDAIRIGEWQRFAAEVQGHTCHFYVGDPDTPKVTFDGFEGDSGQVGFKPRVVGGPVWLDDVRVTSIEGLSYRGDPRPAGVTYAPGELVTDWEVLGPLTRAYPEVEKDGADSVTDDGVTHEWRPFATDPRGAVVTARVVDFLGPRTVAYFRTRVDRDEPTELSVSSIDALAWWLDGVFEGYSSRERYAWYDFGRNPEHPADTGLPMTAGKHVVILRVRGGQYATGGFFARIVDGP